MPGAQSVAEDTTRRSPASRWRTSTAARSHHASDVTAPQCDRRRRRHRQRQRQRNHRRHGSEINAALAGLAYTGNLDFNGADTLTVATSDGTATDTDTIAITVNPVNDAPVNTVPGAQSVAEDTTLPIAGVSVADIDSSALTTTLSVATARSM